jgi:hypothetical protein
MVELVPAARRGELGRFTARAALSRTAPSSDADVQTIDGAEASRIRHTKGRHEVSGHAPSALALERAYPVRRATSPEVAK